MSTTLVNCGHLAQPEGCTTGYGTTPDGYTLCFACIAEDDRTALRLDTRLFAYHDARRHEITNWPGAVLGQVTRAMVGPWQYTPTGGEYRRVYVEMRDVHGQTWRGSGPADNGSYVRLRKVSAVA